MQSFTVTAENVSNWWRHHGKATYYIYCMGHQALTAHTKTLSPDDQTDHSVAGGFMTSSWFPRWIVLWYSIESWVVDLAKTQQASRGQDFEKMIDFRLRVFMNEARPGAVFSGNPMMNAFHSTTALSKQWSFYLTLQWRHNERDGVPDHQPHDFLLSPFIQAQIKTKTSKLRVTGLREGNSSVTGEFPAERPVTRKSFHLMTSSWNNVSDHN